MKQPTKQRKDVKYRPLHKGLRRTIERTENKGFSFSHGFTSRIFVKSDIEPDSNTPMINCFALDSGQASDSIRPTSGTDSSADSHLENRDRRIQRSGRSRVSLPADTGSSSNPASQLSPPSHYPSSISTPASINEQLPPIDGGLSSFGGYPINPFVQPNYDNSAPTDPFGIQLEDIPPPQVNGLGTTGDYDQGGWPTMSQSELDLVFRNMLSELGEDSTWKYKGNREPSPKAYDYNDGRHYSAIPYSHDIHTPLVLGDNDFNSAGPSSLPYDGSSYPQSSDPCPLYDPFSYTNSLPTELQNMQQFYNNDPQLPEGYPGPFDTLTPVLPDYYPENPVHGPADADQQADLDQLLYLAEQQYSAEFFKFNQN